MIDHLSIGTRDLARAKTFYDAALESLGYRCLASDETSLGYGANYYAAFVKDPDGYRLEAYCSKSK